MDIRRNRQSGFGTVEILLVIAIVVIVCCVGWLVYQHNHMGKPINKTAQSSSQVTYKRSGRPAQQYLVIMEWGIELPLSHTISDAYYVVPSGISADADGKPSGVYLGVASLNNDCGTVSSSATGIDNSIGAITRVPPNYTDPVSGKPYAQLYPNGVTIDGYYYSYASRTSGKTCTSQTTLQGDDSAFATAAKNATAVKMAQKYLTITQWGVRAPYSDSDTLSYKIDTSSPDLATIISANLAAKYSGCETFGAGQIERFTPNEGTYTGGGGPTASQAAASNPTLWGHVGNYYFLFIHDQAECGDASNGDQSDANSFVQNLVPELQAY